MLSVFAATKIRSSNSRFVATTAHATGDNGLESLVSSSSAGGREKGEECRPLDEDSVEHEERQGNPKQFLPQREVSVLVV